MDFMYFSRSEEYLQGKTSLYIMKPCLETGTRSEGSLRAGNRIQNLETF